MPRITVILTSFNHEKYIAEAIDSVLAQTFIDFELLIIDDASQDDSWRIITAYTDSRINAFRNEDNNIVNSVNKIIKEVAVGEYIAIFHSDDIWQADKLAQQIVYLDKHPECGAVFTNALAVGEDSKPLGDSAGFYAKIFDQANRTRQQWLNFFFYRINALCHPSVLIRKRCYDEVGLYRAEFFALADFELWVRLCLKYEIHVIPEQLTHFRVRANAANQSGDKIETHVQTATEFYLKLQLFVGIDSFEEMLAIFPEAQSYYRPEGFEPKFVLAMMALQENSFPQTKLFGLGLLFDLLSNKANAARIKKLYDFDSSNFNALTRHNDSFRLRLIAERDQHITVLNQSLSMAKWRPSDQYPSAGGDVLLRLWGDDPRFYSQTGLRTDWGDIETIHQAGYLLYGPYLPLLAGSYRIIIRGAVGRNGAAGAKVDVMVKKGVEMLAETGIVESDELGNLAVLEIVLTEPCTDLEVRVFVNADSDLRVSLVEFSSLYQAA